MPSTMSVTVESGLWDCAGWSRSLRRQLTSVVIPIDTSTSRLVINVFMGFPLL
jgi:hypothetical protein